MPPTNFGIIALFFIYVPTDMLQREYLYIAVIV